MVARNRSKRREMVVVFGEGDRMLLEEPAMPGNHPGRRLELRRHGVGPADSLAESRHPEQVVSHGAAGLAEVVEDARLDLLRRVGGEERPHADGELVLAPQTERYSWSGRLPALMTAVSPRLFACAFRSAVPRSLWSGVCAAWSAATAAAADVTTPLCSSTATPFAAKNARPQTVRDGAGPSTRAGNVDRMPGRRGIQFRPRRPPRLGELRMVPAADAGDELTRRHRLGTPRDRLLKLGDRKRPLDAARLVSGVDPGARVVRV